MIRKPKGMIRSEDSEVILIAVLVARGACNIECVIQDRFRKVFRIGVSGQRAVWMTGVSEGRKAGGASQF